MDATTAKKKRELPIGKKLMYEEIEREFASSTSAFVSRFDRLSVADMSELRRNLEKVSRRTLVVKHTLAKKVFEKMKVGDAGRLLEGSVLVTVGGQEPQLVSKTLVDFAKGRENIEIRGAVLEGQVYDGAYVKQLAKLPSRKELLTQVVTRMQSPIAAFAMTLKSVLQSFVIALNEVQKKRAAQPAA